MLQSKYTTQVYSLFGGGYVPEAHGADPNDGNKRSPVRRRTFLTVVILAISTAAGAIAATNWNRAVPDIWTQETPASAMKLPGGFGVDEILY
jgi:uncharacterized membrane protein YidH (DUF202 family)